MANPTKERYSRWEVDVVGSGGVSIPARSKKSHPQAEGSGKDPRKGKPSTDEFHH